MSLSSFWNSLYRDFKLLKSASPGRRFRDFRRYKREKLGNRSWVSKALAVLLGILLISVGLAIGWLPGPGGFIAILGLAILLPLIPGMAAAMDRMELWIRKLTRAFSYFENR